LLQKITNKITTAIFTIKTLQKIKMLELRQYRAHTKEIDMVIFRQMSPKTQLGKTNATDEDFIIMQQ